jgi:hypothetical protein
MAYAMIGDVLYCCYFLEAMCYDPIGYELTCNGLVRKLMVKMLDKL